MLHLLSSLVTHSLRPLYTPSHPHLLKPSSSGKDIDTHFAHFIPLPPTPSVRISPHSQSPPQSSSHVLRQSISHASRKSYTVGRGNSMQQSHKHRYTLPPNLPFPVYFTHALPPTFLPPAAAQLVRPLYTPSHPHFPRPSSSPGMLHLFSFSSSYSRQKKTCNMPDEESFREE
ncbi:hypothetical protein IQ07DRAFT_274009 [Pyrenochaeta sp. DS3sAY3a]|nr:hypothetical protein IQ07DRAFT_274009 [Pyrenochaeta sp. DS3sAY3a]